MADKREGIENKKLSRREFLKASGLVVGSAAIGGSLIGCTTPAQAPAPTEAPAPTAPPAPAPTAAAPTAPPEPVDAIQWDYEADVVVIGSGGAGLPAALKAMDGGSTVIIVETNWDVGGHAAVSGGNLHSGGGTEIQKRYNIEDSADQYYMDHTRGAVLATRYNDREYVRAISEDMREAYEYIQEKGVLVMDRAPEKPYAFEDGGTEPETVPRWTYTDSSTEGWPATGYTGRTNSGIGITRPLERTFRDAGGQILLNYHMDKIHREDVFSGNVLGIQASYTPHIMPGETARLESHWTNGNIDETNPIVNVKANKAVIIATGGAIGNVRYRTMIDPRLGPEFDGLSGMPFSDQDASGEYAAMEIGASLGTLAQFMQHGGHQITMADKFGCRYGYGSGYTADSPLWKLARAEGVTPDYESTIVVNMLGQRDGNEDKGSGGKYSYDSYDYFNTALSSVLAPGLDGKLTRYTGPHWAIFDQACVERNGYNMEQGGVDWDDGYCFKGETLEELANNVVNKYYEHVKMDPQILVDTVTRYNGFVDKKEDADWGKKRLTNKIETGPFYAAWAMPNLHDSYGGIRVNGKMQAIDIRGDVIPKLYAAGESSAGMRIHGFGRVITSGFIAGKHAAAETV